MVRRLVEDQQVDAAGLQLGEMSARALPRRQRRARTADVIRAQTELREQRACVGARERRSRHELVDEHARRRHTPRAPGRPRRSPFVARPGVRLRRAARRRGAFPRASTCRCRSLRRSTAARPARGRGRPARDGTPRGGRQRPRAGAPDRTGAAPRRASASAPMAGTACPAARCARGAARPVAPSSRARASRAGPALPSCLRARRPSSAPRSAACSGASVSCLRRAAPARTPPAQRRVRYPAPSRSRSSLPPTPARAACPARSTRCDRPSGRGTRGRARRRRERRDIRRGTARAARARRSRDRSSARRGAARRSARAGSRRERRERTRRPRAQQARGRDRRRARGRRRCARARGSKLSAPSDDKPIERLRVAIRGWLPVCQSTRGCFELPFRRRDTRALRKRVEHGDADLRCPFLLEIAHREPGGARAARPGVRLPRSGHDSQQRRLADAVGADQADACLRADGERDLIENDVRAEVLADARELYSHGLDLRDRESAHLWRARERGWVR